MAIVSLHDMRPCYYSRVGGVRVLIPGCFGALHSNDIRDCTCNRTKHRESLEERVEKLEQAVRKLSRRTPGGPTHG